MPQVLLICLYTDKKMQGILHFFDFYWSICQIKSAFFVGFNKKIVIFSKK